MLQRRLYPTETYPDVYVTTSGEVFQKLTVSPMENGYFLVSIRRPGKSVQLRRHTLACEAFHGPRPAGAVVRHGPAGPGDDSPGNISWGTQAENCADAVAHGNSTKGAKNPRALVTEEIVLAIRARYVAGESGTALAAEFSLQQSSVSNIVTRKTWTHV